MSFKLKLLKWWLSYKTTYKRWYFSPFSRFGFRFETSGFGFDSSVPVPMVQFLFKKIIENLSRLIVIDPYEELIEKKQNPSR